MPATIYKPEDIPSTQSWIWELNADEAKTQCTILGLTPLETLDRNRIVLKDYVKAKFAPPEVSATQLSVTQPEPGVTDNTQQAITQTPFDMSTASAAFGTQLAQHMAAMMPALSQSQFSAQTPPVVRDMISGIPVATGDEPIALARFLISATQVADLKVLDQRQLHLMMLGRTDGKLRLLWAEAISRSLSWDETVQEIVENCLPPRLINPILAELFYKPQAVTESLTQYITKLRSVAKLFLPATSPAELLETAITGVNPAIKNSLALFHRPTSLEDLLKMSSRVHLGAVAPGQQPNSAVPTTALKTTVKPNHNRFNNFQNQPSHFYSGPQNYQGYQPYQGYPPQQWQPPNYYQGGHQYQQGPPYQNNQGYYYNPGQGRGDFRHNPNQYYPPQNSYPPNYNNQENSRGGRK